MSKYSLMPLRRCKVSIGLLGGSFNPPHLGHYYASQQAQKRLALKRVYWLVSPQNPLKTNGMRNNLDDRLQKTNALIALKRHPLGAIRASKIEQGFKDCYTSNTLAHLRKMHPETNFVWLVGADNLSQIHRWHRWQNIIKNNHIAVVDRTTDDHKILGKKISYLYPNHNITNGVTHRKATPGRWSFFKIRKMPISSTELRAQS